MLSSNVQYLMEAPATFCLFPALGGGRFMSGILLNITLTAGIVSGIVRQARQHEWKPVQALLVLYLGPVIVWNYAILDRFLVLFLPLFYAGLFIEVRHLLAMLRASMRTGRPVSEKAVAGLLGAGLALVVVLAVRFYVSGVRPELRRAADQRAAAMAEEQEVYEWIRSHTEAGDRFIAYDDVALSLHTGREAIRPIAFSTAAFYKKDENILKRDLAHVADTARSIGARYWVMTARDFALESGVPLIEKRMTEIQAVLPVAFRSSRDKARVYDLGCLRAPEGPACREALTVLLPESAVGGR
jgi:hypothetical protein